MYEKILRDPLVFGPEIGTQARSVLTGLLTRDPTCRLGANGADTIKKHPFFIEHIDFKKLLEKKIQPPFKPSVTSPVVNSTFPKSLSSWLIATNLQDVSNFDTVFTDEEPIDSVVDGSNLSQTVQDQFAGSIFL
jgi:serum/glucocorticoid-regulated kinase 2